MGRCRRRTASSPFPGFSPLEVFAQCPFQPILPGIPAGMAGRTFGRGRVLPLAFILLIRHRGPFRLLPPLLSDHIVFRPPGAGLSAFRDAPLAFRRHSGARRTTLVIPGRAQREPGIHWAAMIAVVWFPGSRRFAPRPGMTAAVYLRHCEPTGRANARPMTGSAKQSMSQHAETWIASSLRSSQ
jgi:hypothetical protein